MSMVTEERTLSTYWVPGTIPFGPLNNSGRHIIPIFLLKKLSLREVKCIAKVTPKGRDQSGIRTQVSLTPESSAEV